MPRTARIAPAPSQGCPNRTLASLRLHTLAASSSKKKRGRSSTRPVSRRKPSARSCASLAARNHRLRVSHALARAARHPRGAVRRSLQKRWVSRRREQRTRLAQKNSLHPLGIRRHLIPYSHATLPAAAAASAATASASTASTPAVSAAACAAASAAASALFQSPNDLIVRAATMRNRP